MIDCKVWSGSDDKNFVYPELDDGVNPNLIAKQNFGIAMSGGGMRAVTLSLGWLRGLHQLEVLDKARYVSSNSGSSWCNGPLGYLSSQQGKEPFDEFFGAYIPPEECSLNAFLATSPRSHAAVISNSKFAGVMVEKLLQKVPDLPSDLSEFLSTTSTATGGNENRALAGYGICHDVMNLKSVRANKDFWSQSIGKIFFESYGLNENNVYSPHKSQCDKTRNKNSKSAYRVPLETYDLLNEYEIMTTADDAEFISSDHLSGTNNQIKCDESASLCPERYYPFPIINASVEIVSTVIVGSDPSGVVYFPLEFTPLYYGIPPRHYLTNQSDECLEKQKGLGECDNIIGTRGAAIGGMLFEPMGFTAKLSQKEAMKVCRKMDSTIFMKKEISRKALEEMNEENDELIVSISDENNGWTLIDTSLNKSYCSIIRIPRPDKIISIADQAGIGSTYLAEKYGSKLSDGMYKLLDFPMYDYFDPLSGYQTQLRYMDGGASDDTGILSLLRRKVTKIIAFCANNEELQNYNGNKNNRKDIDRNKNDDKSVTVISTDRSVDANETSLGCLSGLFGRMKSRIGVVDGISDMQYNNMRKVFLSDAWDELISGLRKKAFYPAEKEGGKSNEDKINNKENRSSSDEDKNNNCNKVSEKSDCENSSCENENQNPPHQPRPFGPVSYSLTTKVLPNPSISIPGNHEVEILFIVNSYSDAWQSMLPVEMQQRMKSDNSPSQIDEDLMEIGAEPTNLRNFPYIPVTRLSYSPPLVGLLSQQASWCVMQNKTAIENLLS